MFNPTTDNLAAKLMAPQHLASQTQRNKVQSAADRVFAEAEALYQQEQYRQAATKYVEAAAIYRAEGKTARAALSLHEAGSLSLMLGERQALEYYEQALPLFRAVGDRRGEATTLNSIGRVYAAQADPQQALKYFEQALPLRRAAADRSGEAMTLNNIGTMYAILGEWQQALRYFKEALPLQRAVGDQRAEAEILNNFGWVYGELGEKQSAQTYYEQALLLYRAASDKNSEAAALNNLGRIYAALGQSQQALMHFEQALLSYRALGNRGGEAAALNNIGGAYSDRGEKRQSLQYFEDALLLARSVGDKNAEAATLNNLGGVYADLGERQQALSYFEQALPLRRAVGDRNGEATTLHNLMFLWKEEQQLSSAVFFGKQAVNRYQELRSAISGLQRQLQRSFVRSKEYTYRELAELLISLGRLPEAQQVLDLLKEEEYFNYLRRDRNEADQLKGRVTLTPTEAQLEKEYAEIADNVTAIGRRLELLSRLITPKLEQLQERSLLEKQLDIASKRYVTFLERLRRELGDRAQAGERLAQVRAAEGFQDTLRDLGVGTVALYTIVGERKYSVMLITPNSQVAGEFTIARAELHRKIFALKDALKNPAVDPRPLAAELYKILIGPIEKNLDGAKAQTLMWSLDGALRYLPMGALYDEAHEKYLIERYRTVMYTPAGASDLKNQPRANWQGVGFGVSKAVSNEEVGSFSALSGVEAELKSVIRTPKNHQGVIDGEIYQDERFTEESFRAALRVRKYQLIHIASHFAFRPGDGLKSFLLLGNGRPLTLEQIRNSPNLFGSVDMLALSACQTGVGEKDQEGREVEGFGVLAQTKGAKAVLATLWPVADESTAKLMQEFYRLRTTEKGINKAEALQQAQLRFLHGKAKTHSAETAATPRTSKVVGEDGVSKLPEYKADPRAPYAHPYYWAPFILIGNWR